MAIRKRESFRTLAGLVLVLTAAALLAGSHHVHAIATAGGASGASAIDDVRSATTPGDRAAPARSCPACILAQTPGATRATWVPGTPGQATDAVEPPRPDLPVRLDWRASPARAPPRGA